MSARAAPAGPASSRSYHSIVVGNVFTVFNVILAAFGALTLTFGHPEDALFIGILVTNSAIGILQEVRAKRALDRLAALVAPTAIVLRGEGLREIPAAEIEVGDRIRVAPGHGLVADGRLEEGDGLLVDESVLTGEAEPVSRRPGDEVRSGSFAVEGTGTYVVTAVGAESYAGRVTSTARTFRHPRSPLEVTLDRLLLGPAGVMVPLGTLLGFALWARRAPLGEAVTVAAAAVVPLIPEGLVLLSRLTYAVGALRLAGRGVLVQQLNAIESLAAIQVICLDKTGTLSEAALRVVDVVPAPGVPRAEIEHALGRFAASAPARNATLVAVAEAFPTARESVLAAAPFSSRRRWSGLRLGKERYVLGAPELFPPGPLHEHAASEARRGRRVLAFGTTEGDFEAPAPDGGPPSGLRWLGVVMLVERLRPDARATVEYLLAEGVTVKVLSGDAPETASAIAADNGIPGAEAPLHGRALPEDKRALGEMAARTAVVGRISPEGKRRFVEALEARGLLVAMVGDGVNDVPALKAARLAIAQGSGVQMAKSVADLVLVRGDFAVVPPLVAEGRKMLRNLRRVTKLFVTKSVFAAFVILTVGLTPESYPLLPRHVSLAAALTIGVLGFFLALAPSAGPWRQPGFLREVARFALPAGTAAGLGVVSSYLLSRNVLGLSLVEARTVGVTVLVLVGLYLIMALEASSGVRAAAVAGLCAAMLLAYTAAFAVPAARQFFDLAVPGIGGLLAAVATAAVMLGALALTDDRFVPRRP